MTLLDNSYITIRFHSARKQFQFKLKSGSNYSSIGISINLTRGNNNTNRGRTTTATASNAESGFFFSPEERVAIVITILASDATSNAMYAKRHIQRRIRLM